jgi:hypothetical protein
VSTLANIASVSLHVKQMDIEVCEVFRILRNAFDKHFNSLKYSLPHLLSCSCLNVIEKYGFLQDMLSVKYFLLRGFVYILHCVCRSMFMQHVCLPYLAYYFIDSDQAHDLILSDFFHFTESECVWQWYTMRLTQWTVSFSELSVF